MNSITIAGNTTRDAETRYLASGDPVTNFSIADNQGRDKPAIFWNCALYGKRAESLAPYLLKGTAVTVTGIITEREWTDKEGNQRKSLDVRVNDIALQSRREEGQAAPKPAQKPAAKPAPADDDFDETVPF